MANKKAMPEAKSCFVIAPIGAEGTPTRKRSDQILKYVIRPAAEACGFVDPVRADQMLMPGIITSQIIERVLEDDLVIADLTGANANVFYELAIRHLIGRPVVQLIEKGEKIPFDVAASRTIEVDHRDLDSAAQARLELERQIKAVMANPDLFENPISVTADLRALRKSGDPEQRSIAELSGAISKIAADLAAVRHDINVLDRFKIWEKLEARFSYIEAALQNVEGSTDLDDISSKLDELDSKLDDIETKIE